MIIKILSLICDFCPSDQRFAYSFLQIPPHDGHPCCSAIHFPLSGRVRDLHPLERAHGAQTQKKHRTFGAFYNYFLQLIIRVFKLLVLNEYIGDFLSVFRILWVHVVFRFNSKDHCTKFLFI